MHLGLCVEDAHSHTKDIVLCYLDFKGAFPLTDDNKKMVRVLEFLDLFDNFTLLVSNLYSGATTEFITPHGQTSPVGILRGTPSGKPTISPDFQPCGRTVDLMAHRLGQGMRNCLLWPQRGQQMVW